MASESSSTSDLGVCPIPLPSLPWANSKKVWQLMLEKEETSGRTLKSRLFEHPSRCLPTMRSVLLNWIMQVCEVFKLRRVTYYLAVDYIDRYLTLRPTFPKTQLQTLGVSSLYVAAKVEEPSLQYIQDFVYVTDDACSIKDVMECEIAVLNLLKWDVIPMTPTEWLTLYMQIYYENQRASQAFIFPHYSSYQFVQASHLIDLFSLDPAFLLFSYRVIAAGAMNCLFGQEVATTVSGLRQTDLKPCAEYMKVFYCVVKNSNDPKFLTTIRCEDGKTVPSKYLAANYKIMLASESHLLQTHVELKYFEEATVQRLQKMGVSACKVLIKLNNDESVDPLVGMFEIEKLPSISQCNLVDSMPVNDSVLNSDYFSSKTKYTFNEMLIGINQSLLLNNVIREQESSCSMFF